VASRSVPIPAALPRVRGTPPVEYLRHYGSPVGIQPRKGEACWTRERCAPRARHGHQPVPGLFYDHEDTVELRGSTQSSISLAKRGLRAIPSHEFRATVERRDSSMAGVVLGHIEYDGDVQSLWRLGCC